MGNSTGFIADMMPLNDALINTIKYQLYTTVNTCLPARIESYDYTKRSASVLPVIKYFSNETQEYISFPLINNVPVVFPYSGENGLIFPVKQGDYCLLVFSQRSLDAWLNNGGEAENTDPRSFSISDAIAIPGLTPFSDSKNDPNNEDLVLRFGDNNLTFKKNGDVYLQGDGAAVKLQSPDKMALGNATNELLEIVSSLMTLLQGANVMGSAFNLTLNPAFLTPLAILQTRLETLRGTFP